MKTRNLWNVLALISFSLLLAACNLPARSTAQTQTPTEMTNAQPGSNAAPTPTAVSACNNQYFPNKIGDSWDYSGNNTALGAYTRSDSITNANAENFTMQTNQSDVTYTVVYSCSPAGLTAADPVQQYAGVILSSPNTPVNVKLNSNSGITLPAKINPGDTWQQTAEWDASSKDINLNGTFVFNYTAVRYETITVPYGTFNALRVDGTIRIEVTGLKILAGTYTTTTWMVTDIGVVKSEGTSHVPGVDFTDSMELTKFTPAP